MVCEHEYMNISPPPQLSSLLRPWLPLKKNMRTYLEWSEVRYTQLITESKTPTPQPESPIKIPGWYVPYNSLIDTHD